MSAFLERDPQKITGLLAEVGGTVLVEKWERMETILRGLGSALVALSGGVDSSLVAAAAALALGERAQAVTIHSPVEAADDLSAAQEVAALTGIRHHVVVYDDLSSAQFTANPVDRCYHCKLARFRLALGLAREQGLAWLLEGSNADDSQDYRPGERAVSELGARSPLREAGWSKPEIRAAARALGLPVWNRPSAPCLATRFPYGMEVTQAGLRQILAGERFLQDAGFQSVRVRHHGSLVRIEVDPCQVEQLAARHSEVQAFFHGLGFQYVTLDLAGYRQGSLNEVILK